MPDRSTSGKPADFLDVTSRMTLPDRDIGNATRSGAVSGRHARRPRIRALRPARTGSRSNSSTVRAVPVNAGFGAHARSSGNAGRAAAVGRHRPRDSAHRRGVTGRNPRRELSERRDSARRWSRTSHATLTIYAASKRQHGDVGATVERIRIQRLPTAPRDARWGGAWRTARTRHLQPGRVSDHARTELRLAVRPARAHRVLADSSATATPTWCYGPTPRG